MMTYRNIEEALQDARDEAAADAWDWLEREKPRTVKVIRYLIEVARITPDKAISELNKIYDITEPKAQRKMRMVIEALAREMES